MPCSVPELSLCEAQGLTSDHVRVLREEVDKLAQEKIGEVSETRHENCGNFEERVLTIDLGDDVGASSAHSSFPSQTRQTTSVPLRGDGAKTEGGGEERDGEEGERKTTL